MFQNPSDSVQGEFNASLEQGPSVCSTCEGRVAQFSPNWDNRGTEGDNALKRERLGCRGTDGRRERERGGGLTEGSVIGVTMCVYACVCLRVCVFARGLGHALLFTLYCLIIDGLNWYPNNEPRLPQMSRRPSDPLTYLPTHPNTGFLSLSLCLPLTHNHTHCVDTNCWYFAHMRTHTGQSRALGEKDPGTGVISWLKSIKEKSCKYNKIITLWEPMCVRAHAWTTAVIFKFICSSFPNEAPDIRRLSFQAWKINWQRCCFDWLINEINVQSIFQYLRVLQSCWIETDDVLC